MPFPEPSSVFPERYSEVCDFPKPPPPSKSGGSPGKRLRVRGSWFPRTNAKGRSPGPRSVHGHLAKVGGVDPGLQDPFLPKVQPSQ